MIAIPITQEMKDYARKIHNIKKGYKFRHQGLDAPDHFYHGTLGELGFGKLLKLKGKKFDYKKKVELGKPDKGDFVLYSKDGKTTADVKTASKPSYVNMLVPTTQKRYPIFVGVRLNGDVVEVHGYCQPPELTKDLKPKPVINNTGMRLDELHPIEELLEILI